MNLVNIFFILFCTCANHLCLDTTYEISSLEKIGARNKTSDSDLVCEDFEDIGYLFGEAVNAYLEENWEACIKGFEETRRRYRIHQKVVISCRKKCRKEANSSSLFFPENIEDVHFYERKLKETLCLSYCAQEFSGKNTLALFPREIEEKLYNLLDYEYLHICYFNKNQIINATNAVFTFLVNYPGHKMGHRYLEHYMTSSDIKEDKIQNLEEARFLKHYKTGVKAYDDENYFDVVENLEKSLWAFLQAEEECRFYCEGSFDPGWFPDFTISIANHFTYCLQCKENCTKKLSTINGVYESDLFPSHYHYLQFAYYKIGDLENTCAATESYLLFYPANEVMMNNKKYYASYPKTKDEYFTPRTEAVRYIKRQIYEQKLLRFADEEFHHLSKNVQKNY